jgi:hypothetical protein
VAALTTLQLGSDGGLALAAADNMGNAVLVLPVSATLTTVTSYAVGNGPISIAAGDLNGDGIPDLAVLNQSDSTATVLTGSASGTFTVGTAFNVLASGGLGGTTGLQPESVAIGDINGDGLPDLVVSEADLSGVLGRDAISYLINQGSGVFATPVSVPAASKDFSPSSVVLGDLNGDGLLDIVMGNDVVSPFGSTGNFVGVLYGQCP